LKYREKCHLLSLVGSAFSLYFLAIGRALESLTFYVLRRYALYLYPAYRIQEKFFMENKNQTRKIKSFQELDIKIKTEVEYI
jgi:hypothetical protein